MRTSKLIILLFLLIGSTLPSWAQSGAFRRLVRDRQEMTLEEYYRELKLFQQTNPQFAQVYYEIGKTELEKFLLSDPIVNRVSSKQFLVNAKTNFGLAKNFLNDKTLLKDPTLFGWSASTSEDSIYGKAQKEFDEQYNTTIAYTEKLQELFTHYDQAVENYLAARKLFIELNNSSDNLRDFFLNVDDAAKDKVREVGKLFDTSLSHLKAYLAIYTEMPIQSKRGTEIQLEEIYHYRMNGMTPTDFLSSPIVLWDYRSWSDRYETLIAEEVEGLREEIQTAYTYFVETNTRLLTTDECLQADIETYKPQRIQNLITKYDPESAMIPVIAYLAAKTDFANALGYDKNCNTYRAQSTDDLLARKARVMRNIQVKLEKADSLLAQARKQDGNKASFAWFFQEHFPSDAAYDAFINKQQAEAHSTFTNQLEYIRNLGTYAVDRSVESCFTSENNRLVKASDESGTCFMQLIALDDIYAIGLGKKGNKELIFGLETAANGYVQLWENSIPPGGKLEFFKMEGDSIFAVGGNSGKGWLRFVTVTGEVRASFSIKALPIANVFYDELGETVSVLQEVKASSRQYSLSKYSIRGKSLATKTFNLPGGLVSTVINDRSFWFFSVAGTEGKQLTASILDFASMNWKEKVEYTFSQPVATPMIIKNDNEHLTVLGNTADGSAMIYSLIDYTGNVSHESTY